MWKTDLRIAALDVGGTTIKSALWQSGALTPPRETPTPVSTVEALLEQLYAIIAAMGPVDAIGISTRGSVGREGEIIFDSILPGYTGTPLRALLEKRFQVPVAVENDVNAAAVGEAALGAGKGAPDFLMVTYGTGVGGAIVLDGKVYRGASSSAGEFGGMCLFSERPDNHGPWGAFYENYAAAPALIQLVQQVRPEVQNGKAVCALLDDPQVSAAVEQWTRRVAYGLCTLVHIFNPPLMVLGGGIMQNARLFRLVEQCTKGMVMPGYEILEMKPALLGNTAGMIGAALLAQKRAGALH